MRRAPPHASLSWHGPRPVDMKFAFRLAQQDWRPKGRSSVDISPKKPSRRSNMRFAARLSPKKTSASMRSAASCAQRLPSASKPGSTSRQPAGRKRSAWSPFAPPPSSDELQSPTVISAALAHSRGDALGSPLALRTARASVGEAESSPAAPRSSPARTSASVRSESGSSQAELGGAGAAAEGVEGPGWADAAFDKPILSRKPCL